MKITLFNSLLPQELRKKALATRIANARIQYVTRYKNQAEKARFLYLFVMFNCVYIALL